MENNAAHPLEQFRFCPKCGSDKFTVNNVKSKRCPSCGFVYYFNPSAAVACFVRNRDGQLLVVRRGQEPAKGTLDLPGGFVDSYETAEDAARREIAEETGLVVGKMRYLWSLPNIYTYSGFDVHTVDMCFECFVDSFEGAVADDDAAELVIAKAADLDPLLFGLPSIRRAIEMYKKQ